MNSIVLKYGIAISLSLLAANLAAENSKTNLSTSNAVPATPSSVASSVSSTSESIPEQATIDESISNLIKKASGKNYEARVNFISAQLLGIPYENEPLGEGSQGYFNQKPVYRLDKFDCETFVDTVMAAASAHNLEEFQHNIRGVRYNRGNISFNERNHFPTADWLANNIKRKLLTNASKNIAGNKAMTATVTIDKPQWYAKLDKSRIYLAGSNTEAELSKRLSQLHDLGQYADTINDNLDYIPLTALFDSKQQPNTALLKKFPVPAVVFIVRPDWHTADTLGSDILVSHMGILVRDQDKLMFRHASNSEQQKLTVSVPLTEYLHQYLVDAKSTVKGIAVLKLTPTK